MPRRAAPPAAVAPVNTLLPPPPPSPLIQTLRKDYRWASISQFCWTFSDAFGLVDWDIDRLEADFDGDETQVIPDLLVKLLFALTYNRQIKRDNVMDNIRKQYEKRTRPCVLGTMEEPIEWATLGLGLKVQLLYELCEIQMEDAARFRGLLKSEEDAVSWRIDPVGWDKDGNTYFLFDDNRLWVQRLPPRPPAPARPPKKSSLKAKRALKRQRQAPPTKGPTAKKGRPSNKRESTPPVMEEKIEEPVSGSRRRTQVSFYGNVTPTVAALKRGANSSTPSTSRSTRATRGNQVEGTSNAIAAGTPSRSQGKGKQVDTKPASLPRGTRVSRRLRDTEDEWQQVPAEWLGSEGGEESNPKRASRSTVGIGNGNKRKLPLDDGEDSELSELSDEELPDTNGHSAASSELSELEDEETEDVAPEEEEDGKDDDFSPTSDDPITAKEESDVDMSEDIAKAEEEDEEEGEDDDGEEEEDEIKLAIKAANDLPEGFIEWEAVCVTLYDWRTFPEQFAKSRDPDEKALYKLLTQQVGPTIIAALVEKLQELARQEAVLNRKRSSRIATIQLSKEETLRAEAAQREMEERMERTRYESTRQEREEAELARRELERENRLKEREERALAREEAIMAKAKEESQKAEQAEKDRQHRAKRREEGFTVVTPTPGEGGKSAAGGSQPDRWELSCEVCKKTGWNVDDDEDVVACEDCGRWQHMGCHDQQDMREGRRKRNWEKVDFRCIECLGKRARHRAAQPSSLPNRQPTHAPHQSNGSTPAQHQHHSSHGHQAHPSPNQYPGNPGPPGLYAHQPLPAGPSRHPSDGGRQGQPTHHNPGPVDRLYQAPVASSLNRGPYPPPPNQHAGPYGAEQSAYPPQSSPRGYPPSSSPRQLAQPHYSQGPPPYPPSPYGPPLGQAARSPYHPQHALPHPQQHHQQAYHPNGAHQPRQTPPQHPQHLPPPHYQHLPPPPQMYPNHPSHPPRPPPGHYPPHPSQSPYQGHPAPMQPHANGHGHQSPRQHQMPPQSQPRMHSGERERSGPAVMHNDQHNAQASHPVESTSSRPVSRPVTQG